jgi:hypothetical protein
MVYCFDNGILFRRKIVTSVASAEREEGEEEEEEEAG